MVDLHPIIQLRLQRGAEHLHACGPRVAAELLAEAAARIGGMPAILTLLTEYQQRRGSAATTLQMTDPATGKALWSLVVAFKTKQISDRFSAQVVEALRRAFPTALPQPDEAPLDAGAGR